MPDPTVVSRLNPQEAYALMNSLVAQATGQADVTVTDTSTFVSAGEKVLATGYENTLNALSLVLGRTIIAVRPYRAKLASIQAIDTGMYSHRLRKISYFSRTNLPAGNFNTSLYPGNLMVGKGHGQDTTLGSEATKSMWLQNPAVPLEMNFSGSDVWQTSNTTYIDQLKVAFRDEASFGDFVAGIMTEWANDIESTKEAFNRMAVLNKIGSIYAAGSAAQKVNLTKAYNDKFGTAYTSAQLRTTYLESFLKFFVAQFKLASDRMEERSIAYHQDVTHSRPNPETGVSETLHLLRHTPKADQKALLYNPLFVDAQAQVFPSIFNPQYLSIDNFEAVEYWQSNYDEDARPAVGVVPAVFDQTSGHQIVGAQVEIPYVVGLIFDRDALLTDFQLEDALATPVDPRRRMFTTWLSMARNVIDDPTENAILFYMEDESEGGSNRVGEAIVGTAEAGD